MHAFPWMWIFFGMFLWMFMLRGPRRAWACGHSSSDVLRDAIDRPMRDSIDRPRRRGYRVDRESELAEQRPDRPALNASAAQVGSRVRLAGGGTGRVAEVRADGKLVVVAGAIRMVVAPDAVSRTSEPDVRPALPAGARSIGPSSHPDIQYEIDLRGMTGDEAEAATVAAVDAAVLAEHPYLRIIHGLGTGVVRERVHRVVRGDRRIAKFAPAPRNQGGSGVTIVEFTA